MFPVAAGIISQQHPGGRIIGFIAGIISVSPEIKIILSTIRLSERVETSIPIRMSSPFRSRLSLRSAVEKLAWNGLEDDAQGDAQKTDLEGHSASLAVTVEDETEIGKSPVKVGLESLSVALCHAAANQDDWLQRQGSNLQPAG